MKKIGILILILTLILLYFLIVWEDERYEKEKQKGVYGDLTEALQNPMDVRVLHLNFDRLKTLPKEIGQLQNLKDLYLYGNQFMTLPNESGELQNYFPR